MEYDDELLVEADDTESGENLELSPEKRKVFTDQGDPEVDSLYRKYKRGFLELQPDFQRGFIWDNKKASRLIESMMLDIPLPVIYLSQGRDNREYVIDGQQRLTSFFSFIDGAMPDGRNFRLTGLNAISELEGKSFKDLSEAEQNKILYYKVRTITFRKESDEDLKFEVFERLNSGSVSLNDQELRNCIYRGNYNDLIKELAKNREYLTLLGMRSPDKRMKEVEFVLRFCAFFRKGYLQYKPSMKRFLNKEMEQSRTLDAETLTDLLKAFLRAIVHTRRLLGGHAFKRFYRGRASNVDGYWEKKRFNASLFDILMDSMARIDPEKYDVHYYTIYEAYIDLMTSDQGFIESIELSTSSTQAIVKRFLLWNNALNLILEGDYTHPRSFSKKLKEDLFRVNNSCAHCGRKISLIEDAAIYMMPKYWKGGKVIPEKSRLAHRYCNLVAMGTITGPEKTSVRYQGGTGRTRVVLPTGCTVDGVWYESGAKAIEGLIRKGKITRNSLPNREYNAHQWLRENTYRYGFTYVRDTV